MGMIDIKFAELHTALFLKGTNLGLKLNLERNRPGYRDGLSLVYDRDEKELLVKFNGEVAIVPTTNVVAMIEANQDDPKVEPIKVIHREKISAQAESPMDHVFAGPGHGKTGKDK